MSTNEIQSGSAADRAAYRQCGGVCARALCPVAPGGNRDGAGKLPISRGVTRTGFRFAPALSNALGGKAMTRGRYQIEKPE